MGILINSLMRQARLQPEMIAIKTLSQSISWLQFQNEVSALNQQLTSCQNLGLLLENSPAWIISDLAAMKGNICNIPLPLFFSDQQLQHAINDANIDHIITDKFTRLSNLIGIKKATPIQIADREYYLLQLKVEEPNSNKITKVTYTSGTTGTPKGVKLSLSQIENVIQALATASQASIHDRALVLLPLSTLLENIGSVYVPIFVGAQILIPSVSDLGFSGSSQCDPSRFSWMLLQCRPTTLIVPPQLLKLLIMLGHQHKLPDTFRYIAVGGAPVARSMLDEAHGLNLPVFQGYGLSEACSVAAVNTPDKNRIGSVGKPLPHQKITISDDGEVLLKGENFSGYLNEESRDSSTELTTGDLGYLDDDGYLYITGRINNRIISSFGRNISPEWIESELQVDNTILQAAVLGNDQPFLIAVLVTSDPSGLNQSIADLNENLPDYAQIKNYIIADQPFTLSNDESTANGRPRRDQIQNHYSDQINTIYQGVTKNVL